MSLSSERRGNLILSGMAANNCGVKVNFSSISRAVYCPLPMATQQTNNSEPQVTLGITRIFTAINYLTTLASERKCLMQRELHGHFSL